MTVASPFLSTTSRDIPLVPARSALLIIDVQNGCALPDGVRHERLSPNQQRTKYGYFFDVMANQVIPNMQKLQAACRAAAIEILYTTIESLTQDGRERGLDYKISGLHFPRGSWEAKVIDVLKPGIDEIVLPKSSSSVFNSTQIDYVLRNLGVAQLIVCGIMTDQCVESAVRDACDLGYLVSLVTDACATLSQDRHECSLRAVAGYARQISTADLVREIAQAKPSIATLDDEIPSSST